MSETISEPAADTGAEGGEYDAIMEQLEGEGFSPSVDQEDPDQQTDDPEAEAEDDGVEQIKLKVNGKEIPTPLPEVIKMAQMYKATELKLETAKKKIEEVEAQQQGIQKQQEAVKQLLGVLQRGDFDTIEEFVTEKLNAGDAFKQAAIKYALKLYEESKMTPEQREAQENRKLVAKLKAEAEERHKSEQQRAFDYKVNQWTQHINQEVPAALKTVGLPDTEFTREQVISTWRAALERGQTPTAAAVAAFVKKRLEDAKMANFTPPAAKAVRPKATPESVGMKKAAKTDETGYASWDEWRKTRGR